MEILFTQYLMPDGKTRPMIIDRPDEIGQKAQALLDAGCRLEIEMLQTDVISMTVERDNEDGETDDLAHELCNNGPEVPLAVDKLITEATAALNNKQIDDKIRAALRNADAKDKLGIVAAVTGVSGGEIALRRIMDSEDEMDIMDRGMLAMHLT